MAAAREGALKGHPALALSAAADADFARAARAGAEIARSVIETGLAGPMLFNVGAFDTDDGTTVEFSGKIAEISDDGVARVDLVARCQGETVLAQARARVRLR